MLSTVNSWRTKRWGVRNASETLAYQLCHLKLRQLAKKRPKILDPLQCVQKKIRRCRRLDLYLITAERMGSTVVDSWNGVDSTFCDDGLKIGLEIECLF